VDDGLKNECVMYISRRVLRRIDCGETDIGVRGNNSVDLKKIGTPCFRKDGIFEGTKENKAKALAFSMQTLLPCAGFRA
jgi:hypothetical protein